MAKLVFNIQDQYLNQSRKEHQKMVLTLLNGTVLEGFIKSFDNFSILLSVSGSDILIYKHSVLFIKSKGEAFSLKQGSYEK